MSEQYTPGLCGVYAIETEQHTYVGASKAIPTRWKDHLLRMKNGSHETPELTAAWNKGRGTGISFKVLEIVGSEMELEAKEYEWMKKMGAVLLNRKNKLPNPREHIVVSRETKSRLQSLGKKSMDKAVKHLLDSSC